MSQEPKTLLAQANPDVEEKGKKKKGMTTADLQETNKRAHEADIAYFLAIPWCAAHLSAPNRVTHIQPLSRAIRGESKAHALVARTLNAPGAIPAYITFYPTPAGPDDLVPEMRAFWALGPMVNGWDGVCHGGLVALILDEAMGAVVSVNKDRGLLAKSTIVTARLAVGFSRPVWTGTAERPNVVLAIGRLAQMERRKYTLTATLQGEDGKILATGESLFVELKESL